MKTNILLVYQSDELKNKVLKSLQSFKQKKGYVFTSCSFDDLKYQVGRCEIILVAPELSSNISDIQNIAYNFGDIKVIQVDGKNYASANAKRIIEDMEGLSKSNFERGKQTMSFMDKLSAVMEQYIVPVGQKISNQRHLAAVRDGLAVMIPATIIGGFSCLIAVPPVPATITEPSNFFYAFLLAWKAFAGANMSVLMIPYYLTISIISVYVVIGVAYRYAKNLGIDPVNNTLTALLTYLCVSGALDLSTGSLVVGKLGAGYMFTAMVVALLVVEIDNFFIKKNIRIKMPDTVPPNVAEPFNVLIPAVVNVVGFILLDRLVIALTGAGLSNLVYTIFQPLMKATGSLPSVLLINVLMTTFWFFGIHGANMLSVVTSPITTAALAANTEAYVAGEALPFIYAGAMNSVFGNWITYNVILLVIFLFCKSNQARSVAKVAIVPSCFNINEPSIFGLPTVLNVYTYIPLIICSLVNCSAYYLAAQANLVGRFYVTLPFTVPGPLQALLATGDVKTVILWFALFLIDIPIVYPFITTYDKQLQKQEAGE